MSVLSRQVVGGVCSLWTPALYDSGQPNLLRVVRDVRPEAIYDPAKMAVGTFCNLVVRHTTLKGPKDAREARMVELAYKALVLASPALLLVRCRCR